MWHFQPLTTPVLYVARHLEPGASFGSPYDAIALVSPAQSDSVLIHGTLSKHGDLTREQWRALLTDLSQECGALRFEADRKAHRVEFVLEDGAVRLRHLGPVSLRA